MEDGKMTKRNEYVIATVRGVVLPFDRMFSLTECGKICKDLERYAQKEYKHTVKYLPIKWKTACKIAHEM